MGTLADVKVDPRDHNTTQSLPTKGWGYGFFVYLRVVNLCWLPGDAIMHVYGKEMRIMKIVQYLKDAFTRIRGKAKAAWSRLREQDPVILDRLKETVGGFLTSPLSDT